MVVDIGKWQWKTFEEIVTYSTQYTPYLFPERVWKKLVLRCFRIAGFSPQCCRLIRVCLTGFTVWLGLFSCEGGAFKVWNSPLPGFRGQEHSPYCTRVHFHTPTEASSEQGENPKHPGRAADRQRRPGEALGLVGYHQLSGGFPSGRWSLCAVVLNSQLLGYLSRLVVG